MGKQPGKGGGKRRPSGGTGPRAGNRDVDAIKLHRARLFSACQQLVTAADAGTAQHLSEHERRIVEHMKALTAAGFKPPSPSEPLPAAHD